MTGGDDRRAEIEAWLTSDEAFEVAWRGAKSVRFGKLSPAQLTAALAALADRVRDARGDDGPTISKREFWTGFRDARGDDERPGAHLPFGGDGQDYPARPPQDEDHEECHDPLPLAPGAVRSRCRRCGAWVEARSPQDHETRSDA